MTDRKGIEEILASLKQEYWEGNVFRVMLADHPPDKENRVGARWNPENLAAIYTSLCAETAIAEVDYHLNQQPRPIRKDLRRTLFEIKVELSAVANIANALDDLSAVGISLAELFNNDWRASQEVGRLAAWFESDGILVPSARAQGLNLVIFPSRVNSDSYRFEIIKKTLLVS